MANEREIRQEGIAGTIEDAPLTSGATTLTSAALGAMAAVGTTDYIWIVLDPFGIGGTPEHVKVTAHAAAATTATIARGQNGTSARQHEAGREWLHGPLASDDYRPRLFHAQDQKALGTAAGTFTSGAWQIRTLNTILTNELGVTLVSNVITGLPSGVYEVDARCPVYAVDRHQARLYDVTNSAVLLVGSNMYTYSGGAGFCGDSFVRGRFTLAATASVRLEHRCATTGLFGIEGSLSTEVYSDIQLRKVS